MEKITVIVKRPFENPQVVQIDNTLEGYRDLLDGGYIETFPTWINDVVIVCDEEGKLKGLPVNFGIWDEVIVGPCFFVRVKGPDFASLTKDQITQIIQAFQIMDALS